MAGRKIAAERERTVIPRDNTNEMNAKQLIHLQRLRKRRNTRRKIQELDRVDTHCDGVSWRPIK